MIISYTIEDQKMDVSLCDSCKIVEGENHVHSKIFNDITQTCSWYEDGYTIVDFFAKNEFDTLLNSLSKIICSLLNEEKVDTNGFTLEKYHRYVNDEIHNRIIAKTRRLYPTNFNIDIFQIVKKIGTIVGEPLEFTNPMFNQPHWIIVRINRPLSNDFNPLHKDTYEIYDTVGSIARMINCWIPISGVSPDNGLPIAPGSHLLPESKIRRTSKGSIVNGKSYSVNTIIDWEGKNLIKVTPNPGEAIIFSSHLIHGLGKNNNNDVTRISLEFRLYGK